MTTKQTGKTTIDWRYHRNSCSTCEKAALYLASHNVEVLESVDARKVRMGRDEALKLAGSVDHIYASRGTKSVHLDLKADKPSDDELIALLIGPTGNLRAPTLKIGRQLLVGFDKTGYDLVFAGSSK
ncbi:MAG TPA: ArsC family (seleno)protein [Candidatus Obscuribacter sp.]|nr:ArsC family (seleno)protein [Candidatus Obscuribacter sp.]